MLSNKPLILAPAGNSASFLAALIAGADAIYCGLKNFSVRMQAKNFNVDELAKLVLLAKKKKVKVYITINSMLKPDEIREVSNLLVKIKYFIKPDGLIIQDLGLILLIKQIGYRGEIHLSTLANVSFPKALGFIKETLNVDHVVIPRELNFDEIKLMDSKCPVNLMLDVFVHGALCYGISGRCYWSSYMGGKSSLRGYCVQPCRRNYLQGTKLKSFFSCYDLSLDVNVKLLLNFSRINLWKIEGRKKGPHYVFSTVIAYKNFRDFSENKEKEKISISLLRKALGRQGSYHNFLSTRFSNPIAFGEETGSGFVIGKIMKNNKGFFFNSKIELFSKDIVRVGCESDSFHSIIKIKKYLPKNDKYYLNVKSNILIKIGTSVFLKDRMNSYLNNAILKIKKNMKSIELKKNYVKKKIHLEIKPIKNKQKIIEMKVNNGLDKFEEKLFSGIWLSKLILKRIKKKYSKNLWIWFPPVIWPSYESKVSSLVKELLNIGCYNFVLNMPWQISFFDKPKNLNIWAGPFCNISNILTIELLKNIGFKGSIVSPELHLKDYVKIGKNSPIPVGIVISGNWPICISRFIPDKLKINSIFRTQRNEGAWAIKRWNNYWIFPDWKLDISIKKNTLIKAGYSLFVHFMEKVPHRSKLRKSSSLWNTRIGLK